MTLLKVPKIQDVQTVPKLTPHSVSNLREESIVIAEREV